MLISEQHSFFKALQNVKFRLAEQTERDPSLAGIYILLLQSIHIVQSIQKVVFKHLSCFNPPTQTQNYTIPVCQ